MRWRHDRQSHPHLHPPRRRRRDAPRRHEPSAQDASADRGLRHGRRAQRAARRRARGARAARSADWFSRASRTTCSTSAPTSRSRTAATASACGWRPSRPRGSSRPATRSTPTLEPLKSFVLPGGTPAAAQLHVCRTVCRRAERRTIDCGDEVNRECVRYLNRLSDLLFILSRARQRGRRAAVGAGALPLRRPATACIAPSTARCASSRHRAPARRPLGRLARAARRRRPPRSCATAPRPLASCSTSSAGAPRSAGCTASPRRRAPAAGSRAAQQRRRPAARAQPGAAARGARRPARHHAARLPRPRSPTTRGDEELAAFHRRWEARMRELATRCARGGDRARLRARDAVVPADRARSAAPATRVATRVGAAGEALDGSPLGRAARASRPGVSPSG